VEWQPDTALVVVDLQNDFADPGGSLYVRRGEEVVPIANALIARAAAAGSVVVYSQDWHPPETPHFRKHGGIWPEHCRRDTWGAQLVPGLLRGSPSIFIHKGTGGEDGYSAFTVRDPTTQEYRLTGLDGILRRLGVVRLVVVGLATDYCVRHTGVEALEHGFDVVVIREAVRAVDLEPGDGERALQELAARGALVVESAVAATR
jgi:nicotinamidase/pyrazinamidase